MSRSLSILLVTVAAGAIPAPAAAASTGTARVTGTTKIEFKAAAGRANNVVINRSGRTVTLDDRVAIKAGKGCKQVKGDQTKVRCTTTKNPAQVRVSLGDLHDTLTNRTVVGVVAYGGSGLDRLTGGSGADTLHGADGLDSLTGGAGNDVLGGDQHNGIPVPPAADVLLGGSGTDRVVYSMHPSRVIVDLDDATGDDGAAGEGDTVGADVEDVFGSDHSDVLTGNDGPNLIGGSGSGGDPAGDVINGLGGNDQLLGGYQSETINGGANGTLGDRCRTDGTDVVTGCEF